jgi:hypothetical protein
MSYNGSGTFVINSTGQPVVTGTTISSTMFNALTADLATGLSTAICKDGQQTVTANIPLGGFKLTGLGAATAVADAPQYAQVQNSASHVLTSVSGTNTILGTASPTPAAYASGQVFILVPANTNTGATTLNVSSLGAKNVFFRGAACSGGELVIGVPSFVEYDGTQFNVVGAGSAVRTLNATALTSGRLPLVTTGGTLTDSATFTWTEISATKQISLNADASTGVFLNATNTNATNGQTQIIATSSTASTGDAALLAIAGGSGDAYVLLRVDTSGTNTSWVITCDNSQSDRLAIGSLSNDYIRITTAGAVTFVETQTHTINGPLAISGASAGQIVFPASQNASANANTLDDYEEGTWTISFTFATVGDLAVSAETKEAYYVKTGKQVFTYWNYTFTPTFTTSAGNAQLTGLPFTSQNNTNPQCIARGTVRHNVRVTYGAGNTNIHPSVTNNATTMLLITQGTGAAAASITTANFTSAQSTDVHGTITYEASA